jgi:predicted DNA-binding WGR domain protein
LIQQHGWRHQPDDPLTGLRRRGLPRRLPLPPNGHSDERRPGLRSIIIMNRCGRIDSNLSLDATDKAGDSPRMTTHSYQLYCQRIDETRNMARYYALSIQPTLFGEISVMRSWGRIGKSGGEKSEIFSSEQQAISHFLALARRKRKRGYVPVGMDRRDVN